jgi:hypothetical protein
MREKERRGKRGNEVRKKREDQEIKAAFEINLNRCE